MGLPRPIDPQLDLAAAVFGGVEDQCGRALLRMQNLFVLVEQADKLPLVAAWRQSDG